MSARRPLVRVSHAGAVATLTLARSSMRNALVPDLLLDLCVALEETARRADTRAVILAADGDAFSIGGDMRRFAAEMQGSALETYAAELVGLLNQSILSLLGLPQPVVAAMHGLVTGGSIGLVLASDVVIAAEDAGDILPAPMSQLLGLHRGIASPILLGQRIVKRLHVTQHFSGIGLHDDLREYSIPNTHLT